MKALVYTTQAKMDGRKVIEPGKCELLDIPEPQLLPTDDMKIRVDYCAMCATDVHIVTMGLYGMPAPWIMGHELCGTIVEVNPRATENGFAVGDKVVVNCTAPCGCCDECKRGHDIFCKHPIAGSFVHGFTEYCTAVCEQNGTSYTVTYNPVREPAISKDNLIRLKILYPEIYKEFVTVSESRRFRVAASSRKAA